MMKCDYLLSTPTGEEGEEEGDANYFSVERKDVSPEGLRVDPEFQLENVIKDDKENTTKGVNRCMFSQQYSHIYAMRLWAMKGKLVGKVKEEWPKVQLKTIAELCENTADLHPSSSSSPRKKGGTTTTGPGGKQKLNNSSDDHEQHLRMFENVTVAVIGTIFKQQPEKPSILQELVEDNHMVPTKPKVRYISDKDVVLLEDETTRVQLVPHEGCGFTIESIVNGVVCAIKGRPTMKGKFEVQDVIWATPSPCVWPKKRESEVEMIFVSGFLLGSNKKNMLSVDLFFDYLQGLCGSPGEVETSLKRKMKLFIIGNSFGDVKYEIDRMGTSSKDKKQDSPITVIAKKLDSILNQLSEKMEVYIIPGEKDPVESMFPQKPLHHCIFPLSSRHSSFKSLSNPTRVHVPIQSSKSKTTAELDIIISGGQNVIDAMRNSNTSSSVEMANNLLKWGHICPTAPDTLTLHPALTKDIFSIKSLPNIFIVGGQRHFHAREWKETLIVTVPMFAQTGTAVVLNKDLNFVPLNIRLG